MQTQTELITPQRAEQYLNHNKSNRKLRAGIVEKYTADMKHGRWTQCPVPIAFYADGDIMDGQHRLRAIVESGTKQRFIVARGFQREDGLNVDTGLSRSLVDNARISGSDPDLSNQLVGVATAVKFGQRTGRRPLSNAERLQVVEKYREASKWALKHGPHTKMIGTMPVWAAMARAKLAGCDEHKLARFGEVLGKGFSEGPHEAAAIALRNYILSMGAKTSSDVAWRDLFLKTQNAISYFVRGRKLVVIKAVSKEAYPLAKRGQQ